MKAITLSVFIVGMLMLGTLMYKIFHQEIYWYNAYDMINDEYYVVKSYNPYVAGAIAYDSSGYAIPRSTNYMIKIISPYKNK